MKLGLLLILLYSSYCFGADVTVSIENSMMTAVSSNSGSLDLGTFDPFNPQVNCNGFIAPNSCVVDGRDNVDISLSFNYDVEIISGASSVDLAFSVDNGLSGTTGSFTNMTTPSPLFNLLNNSSGTAQLDFTIPLFGPNSRSEYGMNLIIDVTINP